MQTLLCTKGLAGIGLHCASSAKSPASRGGTPSDARGVSNQRVIRSLQCSKYSPALSSCKLGTGFWGKCLLSGLGRTAARKKEERAAVRGATRAALGLSSVATKWFPRLLAVGLLLQLAIMAFKRLRKGGEDDAGSSSPNWFQQLLQGNRGQETEREAKQATRNWHASTKGTLVRKFRVPTSSEGHRVLRSVASLLAEDDLFQDAQTHKGCRIQRESAHGESVCCNNVRALFDELPTPHIKVEVTVFPPGPLTAMEYQKAARLEGVLKLGHTI